MNLAIAFLSFLAPVLHAEGLLGQSPHMALEGNLPGDHFGHAVGGVGDLNADGYADVLVGSPDAQSTFGMVWVFSGLDGSLVYSIRGALPWEELGHSIDSIGDVDGDLVDDFVAGSPGTGTNPFVAKATVFSGGSGIPIFEVTTAETGFGEAVSGAGDLDMDGLDDFLVGARRGGAMSSGSVRAYSGSDGSILLTVSGDNPTDYLGGSVDRVDDIDADGVPDFIAGARQRSADPGYARVYSGQTGATLFTFYGQGPGEGFGAAVAGLGDVNRDGHRTLLSEQARGITRRALIPGMLR